MLSYQEILELLRRDVVTNYDETCLNGASLDIRLGPDLLVEIQPSYIDHGEIVDFRERTQPLMRRIKMDQHGHVLKPGDFILAHSMELFHMPLDIGCYFTLKSSVARIGLNQLTACWCDPGWHGSHITLELTNTMRYHSIRLHAADRIGQMLFFRCKPIPLDVSYHSRGRYNNDKTVEGIKP